MDSYSVAVVDDDRRLRELLAQQLSAEFRAHAYGTLDTLRDELIPGERAIVVLGPSFARHLGDGEVDRFRRSRPELALVLLADEVSTTTLKQAMRSGIDDVVDSDSGLDVLEEAITRAADSLLPVPSAPTLAAGDDAGGERGRLITMFSTKGGSGRSFVATNLAVALARRSKKPVALVDADLQFGDVAVMLNVSPRHTIADAVNAVDRLDPQMLKSLLARHKPSGLYILPAPLEPDFADKVVAEDMVNIVRTLQGFCSHVVVDTAVYCGDVQLALLEASDDIVMLAGMDIPAVKSVKVGQQILRQVGIKPERLRVVLNRADSRVKLEAGAVERTLKLKADVRIPSDVLVPTSINRSAPAILDAPKSDVARALEQLADLFFVDEKTRIRGRRAD